MKRLRTPDILYRHVAKAIRRSIYLKQSLIPAEREFRQVWSKVDRIEGFLVSPHQERWLFRAARALPQNAVIVEVGSFNGRSTACLGYGIVGSRSRVYAIDTFDGNNVDFHQRDFLREFLKNIAGCGLGEYIRPVVGRSSDIARSWATPINLLFIDGSHQFEDVMADIEGFFPAVVPGGIVAVHDVVETWPGPFHVWHEYVKPQLRNVGYCSTLGYGTKPQKPNHEIQ